jgi:outer membrane protein OmpA-like peptidoglycan-associated protein
VKEDHEEPPAYFKFVILVIIAILGLVSVWGVTKLWNKRKSKAESEVQLRTSDPRSQAKAFTVAGDGYLGYWFLKSPEMRRQGPTKGLDIRFSDDNGDYVSRLEKFSRGEYQAMVLPVNVYLELGQKHSYPGVIVGVVADSAGADALVGYNDRFPTGKVTELLNGAKVAYVDASPSSFFLDMVTANFDLPSLRESAGWRQPKTAIGKVEEALKTRAVDAAMLWEPELSKALENKELKVILGSDAFQGYIVDVFVVHREVIDKQASELLRFFEAYFGSLAYYQANKSKMLEEMSKDTGIKRERLEQILPHFDWADLFENCQLQFGVDTGKGTKTSEKIVDTISSCSDVLRRAKSFAGVNPFQVINKSVLAELSKRSVGILDATNVANEVSFEQIDDAGWKKLREYGPLNVDPVTFQQGNNLLDDAGKQAVDKAAELLSSNYSALRVIIRGHTGYGDEVQNQALSLERAQVVAQYLRVTHGLDLSRLKAEGAGSSSPPIRRKNEGERAYRARMARVEFLLVEGAKL